MPLCTDRKLEHCAKHPCLEREGLLHEIDTSLMKKRPFQSATLVISCPSPSGVAWHPAGKARAWKSRASCLPLVALNAELVLLQIGKHAQVRDGIFLVDCVPIDRRSRGQSPSANSAVQREICHLVTSIMVQTA